MERRGLGGLGGSTGMEALGARGAGAGAGAGAGRLSWVRVGGAWVRGAPGAGAGAGPAAAAGARRGPNDGPGPRELSWVRTEKGWVRGRLAADAGSRRGRNPPPRLDHGETAELPELGGNILGALSPSADGISVWRGPPETEG